MQNDDFRIVLWQIPISCAVKRSKPQGIFPCGFSSSLCTKTTIQLRESCNNFSRKNTLHFGDSCDKILRYAAEKARKHALMREVADPESGNFRGVCPILNRAKELGRRRNTCEFPRQRQRELLSGIDCDPSNAGFMLCRKEIHGTM